MSNIPAIQSVATVIVVAAISLLLAWAAARLIKYGRDSAKISGTIFGLDVVIAGGIAAWLGSFIVICLVWLEWALPAYSTHEIWRVVGKVHYIDPGDGSKIHRAIDTRDVTLTLIPDYRIRGGHLFMTITVNPQASEEDRFPTIQFAKGSAHKSPFINLNHDPQVEVRLEDRIVDVGEVVVELREAPKELSLELPKIKK